MNLKKLFALVLALVMVLSFAACDTGVGDVDTNKEVQQDANLSEPGTEPIWKGEGTPEISILMKKADNITSYDDNAYTNKLEKDGNVDIKFEFLPAAEADLSIRMKMMGGEDLPMVLNYGLNTAVSAEYAETGAIVNLAPYIRSGIAYYTAKNDEENPELYHLAQVTTAEGNIYALPRYNAALANETKYKMWINIDWLERLGTSREEIKTTDDFVKILRRFRDEDANGNGDKTDEIPFMPTTSWGGTAYKFLTNAFVYEGDGDLLMVKDNKITVSYMQDEWYEAQKFIKSLVDEKLLPTDGFTSNDAAVKALAAKAGLPVVGASTRSSNGYFRVDTEHDYRLQYAALSPLSANGKDAYAGYSLTLSQNYWHVTKAAGEYEQLCVRLGDVQQREDYYIQSRFGNEGENWMKAEDYLKNVPNYEDLVTDAADLGLVCPPKDQLKFVDPYEKMNIKGEYYWFNDQWSSQNANTWYDAAPTFSGVTESKGAQLAHTFQFEISNLYRQCEATIEQQQLMRTSSLVCPPLAFTDEEIEELGTIQSDLRTFISQQRTGYYMGEANVLAKGKEAFIKEAENMIGLDKMLKIMNAAYKRQYLD